MKTHHAAILLSLLLSACASTSGPVEMAYAPPSLPAEPAVAAAVATIATDAKLVSPLETSAVRRSERGPGSYFVCVREINPPPDKPRRTYATFLENDTYKGSRPAVIMDQCELQTYGPAPVAAAAPSPPPVEAVKPAKRKSRNRTG